MIHYENEKWQDAICDLEQCIGRTLQLQHEKQALLTLLDAGGHMENWEICEHYLKDIKRSCPDIIPDGTYILAAAYQRGKRESDALQLYDEIINQYPLTPIAEKTVGEKIALLINRKQFESAHHLLLTFLESFPHSERRVEMMKLAVRICRAWLMEEDVYKELASDIERGMQEEIFDGAEREEMKTLLAKVYLKMDRSPEAMIILNGVLDADPLLMAQCCIKEKETPERIIEYGEKALALYPHEKGLHLHLFNAYRDLAQKEEAVESTRQAAFHLNEVLDLYPISLENRLWLAHYFSVHNVQTAIAILETLLETESNLRRLDQEALLLAALYVENQQVEGAEMTLKKSDCSRSR